MFGDKGGYVILGIALGFMPALALFIWVNGLYHLGYCGEGEVYGDCTREWISALGSYVATAVAVFSVWFLYRQIKLNWLLETSAARLKIRAAIPKTFQPVANGASTLDTFAGADEYGLFIEMGAVYRIIEALKSEEMKILLSYDEGNLHQSIATLTTALGMFRVMCLLPRVGGVSEELVPAESISWSMPWRFDRKKLRHWPGFRRDIAEHARRVAVDIERLAGVYGINIVAASLNGPHSKLDFPATEPGFADNA